jgi:hypothetical protein
MKEMGASHTAENVKERIESIVKEYKFDYSIIKAFVSDEGSNFVRLFAAQENILSLDDNEDDNESQEPLQVAVTPAPADTSTYAPSCPENNSNSSSQTRQEPHESIPNFDNVNEELASADSVFDSENMNISNEIQIDINRPYRPIRDLSDTIDESIYNDQYDLTGGSGLYTFDIQIGSNTIPRYSCANHKLNIATRKAISLQEQVLEMFKDLSSFAKTTGSTLALCKIHRELQSKLKPENQTRWGRSFQMLTSFIKSCQYNAFNDDHVCPIELKELEIYYQILLPLFKMNIIFQRTDSTIGEVVPLLLLTIHGVLDRLDLDDPAKKLCELLIEHLKIKFNYELNSKVYAVAAALKTDQSFIHGISVLLDKFFFNNALDNLCEVFLMFEKNKNNSSELQANSNPLVNNSINREIENMYKPFSKAISTENISQRASEHDLKKKIDKERLEFENIISSMDLASMSSGSFWFTHKKELPLLCQLAYILLGIPASSAFIERYYSICGVICKKRNGNMSGELLIERCMLRANMQILNNIEF